MLHFLDVMPEICVRPEKRRGRHRYSYEPAASHRLFLRKR
ncbi:hypothetical protein B4135_1022 [Caldibacillus debilis]|uniref:Uncharacterized protein n=1 Tax=Caldibacillus debilis TaxID=301148 RepID=A0A150MEH2_9BACI|nr:hypothetical protein B4135_1022 [Caldibacillus debilis]